MDELPGTPKPADDRATRYERESGAGIPRWVKLTVVVALLVGLVILVVVLVDGGEHGPGRHGAAGRAATPTPHALSHPDPATEA